MRVVITGASDGIGRAMALAVARRGHSLALLARRATLLDEVARACREAGSPRVETRAVDVSDLTLFRRTLVELDEDPEPVDFFVANAGIDAETSRRRDCTEEVARVIGVNVVSAIAGIEALKPRMVARGRGTLAGVTSIASARGLPFSGVYCASKAALTTYLESLRTDLAPLGVRVCEISPGFVDTEMTRGGGNPMPFLMKVDRAGEVFVSDLLKGKARVVAPILWRPVYWLLRCIPGFVYDPLSRLVARLMSP